MSERKVLNNFSEQDKHLYEIHFFGTNTIFHILHWYKMQVAILGAKLNKKCSTQSFWENIELLEQEMFFRKKAQVLRIIAKDAECKPILAQFRKLNWFAKDEKVVCFLPDGEKAFVRGRIVNKRQVSGDGRRVVSVEYERDVIRNDFPNGDKGKYFISNPYILKEWEYEYLKNNQYFSHVWILNCIEKKYCFRSAIKFSKALQ
ncbi:MAG: hypothetical protein ABFQ53_02515 [Patescibacteria group bacterium]